MTATTVSKTRGGGGKWWRRSEPPGRDNNAIIGQRKSTPYLFSLPAILLVAAILGFPVLYGVWQSLYRRPSLGLPAEWVGFENYADMFSSADFWHSLNRTTIFVFGSLILGTALGLFFAFARKSGQVLADVVVQFYLAAVSQDHYRGGGGNRFGQRSYIEDSIFVHRLLTRDYHLVSEGPAVEYLAASSNQDHRAWEAALPDLSSNDLVNGLEFLPGELCRRGLATCNRAQ